MDNINNLKPETGAVPASGETGQLFRSALGGFNKQDVTDYIERMSRDRRRDAERYSAHIRSLEEELTINSGENAKLRSGAAEYTRETYKAKEEKAEAEKLLAVSESKNDTLTRELAKLTEQLDKYKEAAMSDNAAVSVANEKLSAELAVKDDEIKRLYIVIETLEKDKAKLENELEILARRTLTLPKPEAESAGAALIRKVSPRSTSSPSRDELDIMRGRIERARQRAEEGLSECTSLYAEMKRNVERLEEILRDLNG